MRDGTLTRQGMSDLAIRNWFIIPTIAFLIVFNIFPLLYSLGFSFTDYRAASNRPANFIGLQNYQELLTDDGIWNNFTITAKYVIISVAGQVIVGFGMALLLNRRRTIGTGGYALRNLQPSPPHLSGVIRGGSCNQPIRRTGQRA